MKTLHVDHLKVSLLIIFVLLLIQNVSCDFSCFNEDVCSCRDNSINCLCRKRENLVFSGSLYEDGHNAESLKVQGCGEVKLRFGGFGPLKLISMAFQDIEKLSIMSFAFSGAEILDVLEFMDIQELEVAFFGLFGLSSLRSVLFRNVAVTELNTFAVVVSYVNQITIDNCTFNDIQDSAFIANNVTEFNIIDSHISQQKNYSIMIHNAGNVVIRNSMFESTDIHSFHISFAEVVNFHNNKFQLLQPNTFYVNSTKNFNFEGNYVNFAASFAFQDIDAANVDFKYNEFYVTENFFLDPLIAETSYSDGNEFFCSNDLLWICDVRSDYESLILSSKCSNIEKTDLISFISSEKGCNTGGSQNINEQFGDSSNLNTAKQYVINSSSQAEISYLSGKFQILLSLAMLIFIIAQI